MTAMFTMSWLLLTAVFGPAAFPQASSMDGVWRTQGYGDVLQIEAASLRAFEVTATTCVPGFTATRATADVPGREATFSIGGGGVFFVRAGGSADHKVVHNEGSASDVRIDRLPR